MWCEKVLNAWKINYLYKPPERDRKEFKNLINFLNKALYKCIIQLRKDSELSRYHSNVFITSETVGYKIIIIIEGINMIFKSSEKISHCFSFYSFFELKRYYFFTTQLFLFHNYFNCFFLFVWWITPFV